MADSTLTNLTATTTLASGDLLYVVDGGNSRKIDWDDVVSNIVESGTETITLSAPSKTIPGSPAEVVPFDTAYDSDGGAWRHRVARTSWMQGDLATGDYLGVYANAAAAYSADGAGSTNWYWNSTTNTLEQLDGDGTNDTTIYRGSTQKFPARGFIVVYSTDVVICEEDGTPWIVFPEDLGSFVYPSVTGPVAYRNGQFWVGSTGGLGMVDLVADTGVMRFNTVHAYNIRQVADYAVDPATISTESFLSYFSENQLVDRDVNYIAITVLPDAPIDPATGLPKPTIAVATDGGLSVFTHDGDVYDSSSTAAADWVICTDQGVWWAATSGADLFFATWADVDAGDGFGDQLADTTAAAQEFDLLVTATSGVSAKSNVAMGGTAGLMLHVPNYADQTEGMSVLITKDYNTCWMHGECELALCDGLTDRSVTGTTVTDNGAATTAAVETGADLIAITASGGTITAPVTTGGAIYGWEKVSGVWYFRRNADWDGVSESTGTLTIADGTTFAGLRYTNGDGPSTEQYDYAESMEKHLFRENADCTLYGASDAVLDVSYDPVRDEHSVVTSGGRSSFSGLRRVSEDASVTTSYHQLGDLAYEE